MSHLGQKAKYSRRADLFRSAPDSRLDAAQSARPFRAKIGSRGSTLIVRRLVHFLVSDPAAAPNALPQTVAPIALAKDLFRSRLEAWFPPTMMVGSLGSSAAGLTLNLEPLFTSAAHTSELFEEPVRIDQRVGFARLASRQPVVSFR